MRRELHGDGVRVTIVAPGFVDTPIFDGVEDVVLRDHYRQAAADPGLAPEQIGEQLVHALAAPLDLTIHELALYHTDQD